MKFIIALFSISTLISARPTPADLTPDIYQTMHPIFINSTTVQTSAATWELHDPSLNSTACGVSSSDTDLVVGLPLRYMNTTVVDSSYCGAYVVLVNPINGLNVTARVASASGISGTISLSIEAWRTLHADSTNMTSVTWSFASQPQSYLAEMMLLLKSVAISLGQTVSSPPPPPPAATPVLLATPTHTPDPVAAPTPEYVAPPAAPAPQQQSGSATYFYQNGAAGHCGNFNPDSSSIVAISSSIFQQSDCGRQIQIKNNQNGRSTTVTVADSCPGCNGGGSVDLSVAAFDALGSQSQGVLDVSWNWV